MYPATLTESLIARAAADPEQLAFRMVNGKGAVIESWSYRELDLRARAIGSRLVAAGARGQPVVVTHPPGLEFIAAFFGCLYAGAIAVPTYPPDPMRLDRSLHRLQYAITDCGARLVLTTRAMWQALRNLHRRGYAADSLHRLPVFRSLVGQRLRFYARQRVDSLSIVRWMATDRISTREGRLPDPLIPTPDALAYLQYTSGSTTDPRGVMLSHANVIANITMGAKLIGASRDSVAVGWLPLYHDMGLVCQVIASVVLGFPSTLIAPGDFLRRPMLWLEMISRYRGTHAASPDFGFQLCVRKSTPAERAALDLRTWRMAGNGGEKVRASTLLDFCDAFAPSGFRSSAFAPSYGLAEATLFIASGKPPGADPRLLWVDAGALARHDIRIVRKSDTRSVAIVGHGRTGTGHEIRIVDPHTMATLPERRVGEILFCGPSVATGYFGRDEKHETFDHSLQSFGPIASDPLNRRWLRTGDLGFIDKGDLFITGRLTDLIVVRGRNLYPTDLERTLECANELFRAGRCAVFSIEAAGEERVVAVAEVDRVTTLEAEDFDQIFANAVQMIADAHQIRLEQLRFIAPYLLPKTSSGKVQRSETRRQWLDGELEILAERSLSSGLINPPPASTPESLDPVQSGVLSMVSQVLETPVALDDSLLAAGLDSLALVEIVEAVASCADIELDAQTVFNAGTCRGLVEHIVRHRNFKAWRIPSDSNRSVREPDIYTGWQPATPAQYFFWRTRERLPGSYRAYVAFDLIGALDHSAIQGAWQLLLEHNPVLRSRFDIRSGTLQFCIEEQASCAVRYAEAYNWSDQRLMQAIADDVRDRFDFARPPLARATLYRLSDKHHVLHWMAHHCVLDAWSFSRMSESLLDDYAALAEGRAVSRSLVALPVTTGETVSPKVFRSQGVPPICKVGTSLPLLYGTAERRLDKRAVLKLRGCALNLGVTLSSLMLTVYLDVLASRLERDELVVALPMSSRTRESEHVAGPMMHFMPLHYFSRHASDFETRVAQVARSMNTAIEFRLRAPDYALDGSDFPDIHYNFYNFNRSFSGERLRVIRRGGRLRIADVDVAMRSLSTIATVSPVAIGLMAVMADNELTLWLNGRPDALPRRDADDTLRGLLAQLRQIGGVHVT